MSTILNKDKDKKVAVRGKGSLASTGDDRKANSLLWKMVIKRKGTLTPNFWNLNLTLEK